MDNELSALIARAVLYKSAGKTIPKELIFKLYDLEKKGRNVIHQLKLLNNRFVYIDYMDYTKCDRTGKEATVLPTDNQNSTDELHAVQETAKGYRRADSLIGYFFTKLNRMLTDDLVASVKF